MVAPTMPSRAARAPDSYTPKHLAERIVNSKAALEGERKQVTVLFADLKGSMELLADRDPEEARKILDPVLEHMMEAVHRYEGTVNQVMGDGIMALFGAPLAHEDHAVRACYAALRMQESVKRYAEEIRQTRGIGPQIRVGLNSGEVVVRAIGSDLHMDYTAVWQTTHLAARMEQLVDPGTILLTTDTRRLAEGFVEVVALGARVVKGMAGPIQLYELTRVGRTRARFELALARGLTHLVGRNVELESLQAALERAGAGHGQVVAMSGPPGVGKSRLVWELISSRLPTGFRVLHSRSVSHGKATSYLPLVDLLNGYLGADQQGDVAAERTRITETVFGLDAKPTTSAPEEAEKRPAATSPASDSSTARSGRAATAFEQRLYRCHGQGRRRGQTAMVTSCTTPQMPQARRTFVYPFVSPRAAVILAVFAGSIPRASARQGSQ